MPLYTYRREDGTTFDIKQKFLDEPLELCPTTGQKVIRLVQAAGIIFKGSGFYVTDNNKAANSANSKKSDEAGTKSDSPSESASTSSSETKTETKTEAKAESKTTAGAAAD